MTTTMRAHSPTITTESEDIEYDDNKKSIKRKLPVGGLRLNLNCCDDLRRHIPPLPKECDTKTVVRVVLLLGMAWVVLDNLWYNSDQARTIPSPAKFSEDFLAWVETHPIWGLGAIMFVIAGAVVSMVPIGTPLTVGCGYIYRGVYGWGIGLFIANVVSMTGSALGALTCFLLGRYMMREQVKKWVRKYPLFDAIDVAASEHGLRIMAMLYLTPVLPLGIVSYMCGTTSMSVSSFMLAKIASLPLYLIYTFLGASAHSLLKKKDVDGDPQEGGFDITKETKHLEENRVLILSGIVLSVVMMTFVTRHIKKELMKILESQKKHETGDVELVAEEGSERSDDNDNENISEGGLVARQRRAKTDQHGE